MNYHDNKLRNNERNNFIFSFLKPILESFKLIYILKSIQLLNV